MTGFVGGTVVGSTLDSLVDELHHEPWYERERFEEGTTGLGFLHHGAKDPAGHTTWQGDGRAGIVHGAISNVDRLGVCPDEVFERVLDDTSFLAELDGPFVIACLDAHAGRLVVATDKLGTRPCYYAHDDGVVLGSSLAALLPAIDAPAVDEHAVSDMLLLGNVWGERTLVEGVSALGPATVLEYDDAGVDLARYWKPDYDSAPRRGYVAELVRQYRQAMADVSTTVDGELGLWLSGGLDSRSMAAELRQHAGRTFDSLTTYTYDANPKGGGNPEIAARVASVLDVDNTEVELDPDTFLDIIEESVDLVDGMLRWSSLLNLSTVFSLPNDGTNVLMEASGQGELIGQHPRQYHFTHTDSVVEGLMMSEAMVDASAVDALLTANVDPKRSLRESGRRSAERTTEKRLLDVNYTNYYSRMAFASNEIMRSQVGTRVPFAHGDFLEHTARLPIEYRMGTFPLTKGAIPYGMTRPKHALARSHVGELSRIPYERTGLGPVWPYPAQLAGFVCKTGVSRLRSNIAYGGGKTPDEWYRQHPAFRAYIDELLDDACQRSLFRAEAIRRLQRQHHQREANHVTTLVAAITTVELWLQRNLDPQRKPQQPA
ncbi:asparagine synthase-related protein [Halococcus agarilyticus]|uniref:asparagine synthase-related protein n=1 Tax=Halococcus agarilyticus TaxID=1232219 RepID=UPI00067806CC|nr:asparagine synthase-related protein [Halococcus agarilyticus]